MRRLLVAVGIGVVVVAGAGSWAVLSDSGSGGPPTQVRAERVRRTPLATAPPTTAPVAAVSTTTAPPATFPRAPVVITNGPRDQPRIALTFDSNLTVAMIHELDTGAVGSFYNQAVVDELDALHVPATFFLTGLWMERYPEATQRLAADPLFELGSHSYSHRAFHLPCYGLGGMALAEMADDVRHSFDVLHRFTDHATTFFRFPGGCYDQAALDAITPTGVTVIQYDLPSGDAFGTSVGAIVQQTLSGARNGSIVVMHVTGGNTAPLTAQALPQIVAGLRARGFQLVKLSELLTPAP